MRTTTNNPMFLIRKIIAEIFFQENIDKVLFSSKKDYSTLIRLYIGTSIKYELESEENFADVLHTLKRMGGVEKGQFYDAQEGFMLIQNGADVRLASFRTLPFGDGRMNIEIRVKKLDVIEISLADKQKSLIA